MLCDNCKKREAEVSVNLEQVYDKEKSELHLCYRCSLDFDKNFFINSLLNDLLFNFTNFHPFDKEKEKEVNDISCEGCSLTLYEFKKIGKLGCGKCYESFKKDINNIIEKIQWSEKHKGKIPKTNAASLIIKKEIETLKEELKNHIDLEQYEEAAKIRDKIKEIERGV
ncbi:MAG: UvrB/UvrC motif-containing protein [Defluviitaleaceae bacterium]|nr:UvrB/UvrC motif-containing protein [Defluviitaleaceae bacterium]